MTKQLLNWGAFALFLVLLFVFAAPTAVGGPASYVVVTGTSMEPTYDDGDLVVATVADSYDVGDVVVYDAPGDRRFTVIHRIIETTAGGFITQGDNRAEPDGWVVAPETIRGTASVHVPHGGSFVRLVRQPPVVFAVVAGVGALMFMKRRETAADEARTEEVGREA